MKRILLLGLSLAAFVLIFFNNGRTNSSSSYASLHECVLTTGLPCYFSSCDYKCPLGYTKGYVPQDSNGLLARVTRTGGLCPEGACFTTIEIMQGGEVLVKDAAADFPRKQKIGDSARLTDFLEAFSTTNFDTLKDREFEGTCPTAFDGQKTVYEFFTKPTVVVVDSCEHEIDREAPIYRSLEKIILIDVDGWLE